MGKILFLGNFIPNNGNTSLNILIAWHLSKKFKVLLIDLDSNQKRNASQNLFKTTNFSAPNYPIYNYYEEGKLLEAIRCIKENLFLLPSDKSLTNLSNSLDDKFQNDLEKMKFFKNLMEPLKANFDFILIDYPSYINDMTDYAVYTSDYCIVIYPLEDLSLKNLYIYKNYLDFMQDKYSTNIKNIGVLTVSTRSSGKVPENQFESIKSIFPDIRKFNTELKHSARINRWMKYGITEEDLIDSNLHRIYQNLCDEIIVNV